MIDLSELKKLNLPRDKFAIFGSGPMAIRDIRDARDVDIIVKKELWDNLSKEYKVEKYKAVFIKEFIKIGQIEVLESWLPWLENTDELIDTADIMGGFRFVKLMYVLEWKRKFNREKDRQDIKLINDYMRTGGS